MAAARSRRRTDGRPAPPAAGRPGPAPASVDRRPVSGDHPHPRRQVAARVTSPRCAARSWRALAGWATMPIALDRRSSDRIGVAIGREDLGDPVDGGHEPHRVPGRGAGDDRLQPVLGVGGPHIPLLPGPLGALFGQRRVGVQDRRGQDAPEPAPRQQPQRPGQLGIQLRARLPGQRPGHLRDLAGLPPADLPGLHLGPQPGQAMPQIQRIRHQHLRAQHPGPLQRGQLGHTELRDLRCARSAVELRPLHQRGILPRLPGVQIRPRAHQFKRAALRPHQLALVASDRRRQLRPRHPLQRRPDERFEHTNDARASH